MKQNPTRRSEPLQVFYCTSASATSHVTLAYLKGKEAVSEEAQEHANSSSLALYA